MNGVNKFKATMTILLGVIVLIVVAFNLHVYLDRDSVKEPIDIPTISLSHKELLKNQPGKMHIRIKKVTDGNVLENSPDTHVVLLDSENRVIKINNKSMHYVTNDTSFIRVKRTRIPQGWYKFGVLNGDEPLLITNSFYYIPGYTYKGEVTYTINRSDKPVGVTFYVSKRVATLKGFNLITLNSKKTIGANLQKIPQVVPKAGNVFTGYWTANRNVMLGKDIIKTNTEIRQDDIPRLKLKNDIVMTAVVVSPKTPEEKAKLEAELKARTEAYKKAKTEADKKAKTEADKKAKTEADKNAKTEADKKAKTKEDKKANN